MHGGRSSSCSKAALTPGWPLPVGGVRGLGSIEGAAAGDPVVQTLRRLGHQILMAIAVAIGRNVARGFGFGFFYLSIHEEPADKCLSKFFSASQIFETPDERNRTRGLL